MVTKTGCVRWVSISFLHLCFITNITVLYVRLQTLPSALLHPPAYLGFRSLTLTTMEIPTTGSVSVLFILLAVAVFGLVVGKFYIARKSIWERQKKGLVTESIQLLLSTSLTTSPQSLWLLVTPFSLDISFSSKKPWTSSRPMLTTRTLSGISPESISNRKAATTLTCGLSLAFCSSLFRHTWLTRSMRTRTCPCSAHRCCHGFSSRLRVGLTCSTCANTNGDRGGLSSTKLSVLNMSYRWSRT